MQDSRSQILSWVKFLIGWPLSTVSILFIVKLVIDKSSQISLKITQINLYYLFLGIFFFFVYYLMRNFLWWQMLKDKNYKINFRENTYRFSFSEIKRYTPGNVWSFLSRASLFNEIGVDKKTVGICLLADIQLVIIGCGIVSLGAIPWLLDSPDALKVKLVSLIPISIIAAIIFFIATGLVYKKRYEKNGSLASALILPGFKFNNKIKLSFVSLVTYFIFGIGNYFVFSAIFNGGFTNILAFVSFFVFSLLIGFLSFVAPTGLGVREAVVTLGLSKIMSITDAGVISIFSRIILIVSELTFIFLIFLWHKSSKK